MSKQTGIAVVGVGRWGVHLVRNFLKNPQARVVAVVDRNPERLAALKEQLEFDAGVVLAADWEQVRQMPAIEAVAIATPASTHYHLIADALQQGYHVLAEKPLTLDPEESQELCRLAQEQHRQLVVDHTYLFHPAVERGKRVIQEGHLGELRYGYATRTHLGPVRPDVDALWDLAIHDICIFNSWLGETPAQVGATGTIWLQSNWEGWSGGEHFPRGLSDLVWVTLTYPSGVRAFIHLCWSNPDKQRRLAIAGSQGTLIFDEMLAEGALTLQRGQLERTGDQFIPAGQSREAIGVEPVEPLAQVCQHFLDCARSNTPSPVSSGATGVGLVRTLSALSESVNRGGEPVRIANA
ncbi:Gfo/Idh/MocA family protein [Kamptonema formosum]|uniref:Gfo/Idh/MocA family protein n=1 Tax=Kamptonema formosum TaxID=331992 RepID=UPI00035F624C|nr:Gfo/Idh/MocA family oxidoreductase [Oscillatoria sp. PCC 10802]